jgi:hypothetical protein
MRSFKKISLLLLSSGAALFAMSPVQAASWTGSSALSGTNTATNVDPNWSIVRRTGTPCNAGPSTLLTAQYTNGPLGGKDGLISPDQPIVAKNLSGSTFNSGVVVPPAWILMHPGPANECAILRFTVPSTQPATGMYNITAKFLGAYPMPGVVPLQPGMATGGDGVKGYVVTNGTTVLGTPADTSVAGGQTVSGSVSLAPGNTIDFAVHMKTWHNADSTLLDARIEGPNPVSGTITIPGSQNETVSPCCAPWAKSSILQALSMTGMTFGSGGGYYAVNSIPSTTLSSLQGYLNMIASSTGATQLQLKWEVADLGTATNSGGTAPLTTSGTWPQVAGTSAFTVSIPMTGAATYSPSASVAWPMTASPNQPFKHLNWYAFKTTISHNGQNQSPYLAQNCKENVFLYRSQPLYKVAGDPNSGISSVEYQSIDANGRLIKAASFKQLMQAVQGSRQDSAD